MGWLSDKKVKIIQGEDEVEVSVADFVEVGTQMDKINGTKDFYSILALKLLEEKKCVNEDEEAEVC